MNAPEFGLGMHWLVEAYNCDVEALSDVEGIKDVFATAARAAKMTVVQECYHLFEPHGVSGATIVSESHLTVHTWPEFRYAAIDIFVCGPVDISKAVQALEPFLKWDRIEISAHARGLPDKIKEYGTNPS